MNTTYKTFRYRVKGASSAKRLVTLGNSVNTIWNHCNGAQLHAINRNQKWPSYIQMHDSTKGSSKLINLSSQIIQVVCKEYTIKRKASCKSKLRWRTSQGPRRSLGWVPFTNQDIKIGGGIVALRGQKFRLWQHREIIGNIKSGNFSQDARGRWYCNIICEINDLMERQNQTKIVGIDLGFKTVATAFNAPDLEQARFYRDLEPKLAEAQRKGRKRQVRSIHAKIANRRKDALHKYSRAVVNDAGAVFVGNISSTWQIKTGKGKATLDVSWSMLRNFLKYKCDHAGVGFAEVDEKYTTQACSDCGSIGGPKGAEGLGIRQWVCCECGSVHDRDLNAAVNIARLGCQTLGLKWSGSFTRNGEKTSRELSNIRSPSLEARILDAYCQSTTCLKSIHMFSDRPFQFRLGWFLTFADFQTEEILKVA